MQVLVVLCLTVILLSALGFMGGILVMFMEDLTQVGNWQKQYMDKR